MTRKYLVGCCVVLGAIGLAARAGLGAHGFGGFGGGGHHGGFGGSHHGGMSLGGGHHANFGGGHHGGIGSFGGHSAHGAFQSNSLNRSVGNFMGGSQHHGTQSILRAPTHTPAPALNVHKAPVNNLLPRGTQAGGGVLKVQSAPKNNILNAVKAPTTHPAHILNKGPANPAVNFAKGAHTAAKPSSLFKQTLPHGQHGVIPSLKSTPVAKVGGLVKPSPLSNVLGGQTVKSVNKTGVVSLVSAKQTGNGGPLQISKVFQNGGGKTIGQQNINTLKRADGSQLLKVSGVDARNRPYRFSFTQTAQIAANGNLNWRPWRTRNDLIPVLIGAVIARNAINNVPPGIAIAGGRQQNICFASVPTYNPTTFVVNGKPDIDLIAALNKQAADGATDFAATHLDPDEALEALKSLNNPAIDSALAAKDPDKLADEVAKVTDPQSGMLAGELLRERIARDNLVGAVLNGATSGEIARRAATFIKAEQARLEAQMARAGSGLLVVGINQRLENDVRLLNTIVAARDGAEVLLNIANGGFTPTADAVPLPTGQICCIWTPTLPTGQCVAIDATTMLVGTGEGGQIVADMVNAADAGFPVVSGKPVPEAKPVDDNGPRIVLKNPEGNSVSIGYLLDNQVFSMEPGFNQKLPSRDWLLTFDRGGSFGEARYTLSSGRYEFSQTEKGWDVVSKTCKIVLDNSANPNDFYVTINSEEVIVKAREAIELSDPFELSVQFDGGNGRNQSKLLDNGTYSIAVNPATRLLDLYTDATMPVALDDEEETEEIVDSGAFEFPEIDLKARTDADKPIASNTTGTPAPQIGVAVEIPGIVSVKAEVQKVNAPAIIQPPPRVAVKVETKVEK